jgi:putative endonuclease
MVEHGFVLVARNLRLGALEIDIVARDGPVVVVVEVRSRRHQSFSSGFSSFSAVKRKRVRWAGERLWNRRYRHDSTVQRMRFDAASVTWIRGRPFIEYTRAAF